MASALVVEFAGENLGARFTIAAIFELFGRLMQIWTDVAEVDWVEAIVTALLVCKLS